MRAVWRVGPEVAWVDDEKERVAVLDLDSPDQLPLVLTQTSAVIWLCVDGASTDDEIVMRVAEEYEVNADDIREQVLAFLTELDQRHLIVRT